MDPKQPRATNIPKPATRPVSEQTPTSGASAAACDVLFDYMRDMLYSPETATLALESLPPEFRKLGEGLRFFAQCLAEQRQLALDLARGDLSGETPSPENPLAGPLKALHASLRHLTWQTQQVAQGDYTQQLDFMGEFADAFNRMTDLLASRQEALEREVAQSRAIATALEQSRSLLESITERSPLWIVVVQDKTGSILFLNLAAEAVFLADDVLAASVRNWLALKANQKQPASTEETLRLFLKQDGRQHDYQVVSYPVEWRSHAAVAYVFTDVSAERDHVRKLEGYAYQDQLTGLANRHSGMQSLRDWLETRRPFAVCFADLDNLKFVNDTLGHNEGDEYIRAAAHLLAEFSPGALACRLGGDEFMVLAPEMTKESAARRMEMLRERLESEYRRDGGNYLRSISFGVAEDDELEVRDAGRLLALADERMYADKRARKFARRQQSVRRVDWRYPAASGEEE